MWEVCSVWEHGFADMPWFLTLHSMSLVSSVDGIKRSSGSRCSKRHAARSQASDRFLQRTQGDATPPETQSECQDFSRSATTQQSMKQVLVLCSLLTGSGGDWGIEFQNSTALQFLLGRFPSWRPQLLTKVVIWDTHLETWNVWSPL